MIGEFKASNGKFYIFFKDRIHQPIEEFLESEPQFYKKPDRFYEGEICKKCGSTKRYTRGGKCVACRLELGAKIRERKMEQKQNEQSENLPC
ncbi:hypothetical protein KXY27_004559 [Salmonella enterica]|nr:hypothetical protein [Salmonella enterica]EHU5767757.1 hypothetical protein [Salmonella enterica]